jgi:hypothetical protein
MLFALLLAPLWALAAGNPRLAIPDFNALSKQASDSVAISLDASLLGMAAGFLDDSKPQDAATKEVIKGLQGIYVRSYTFDHDGAYSESDIDAIRKQLTAPGWNQLVQTRSRKTHSDVDIYVMLDGKQAIGLALIASEPREFTIVNIIGAIDLDKLHKLEGQFGVPKLDADAEKPLSGERKK